MSSTDPATTTDGPSLRAVAFARFLLIIFGFVWLVIGGMLALGKKDPNLFLGLVVSGVGVGHFAMARFASKRVAVFAALFGP